MFTDSTLVTVGKVTIGLLLGLGGTMLLILAAAIANGVRAALLKARRKSPTV
jgi:hypothetical protein